jgi:uncharacterized lipoprotein YddW (UPF0748 family)
MSAVQQTLLRFGSIRLQRFSQTGLLLCLIVSLMVIPASVSRSAEASMTGKGQSAAPVSANGCPTQPARQFRAAWIATVANMDWPSHAGLNRESQQREFRSLLDRAREMHLNAVVVQIKPMADAFYPSQFGPWSQYLTGTQGKNPGYDPLAFMLIEAHKRHLEFHAWFNPYRVSMQADPAALSSNHPARRHPDWLMSYGNRLYYNPGIPAARAFVVASVLEVVRHYDIDGVHLDDYFYPYPIAGQEFPDEATYQKYGAAHFSAKGDWRRDNVNRLVHELSTQIHALKPRVSFGISPFGVWRNRSSDPSGSDTRALQNYDDLYADTRTWIRRHWLDYIAPQLYWNIGFELAAYEKVVAWWSHEVAGSSVRLYIGQGAFRIPAWEDAREMDRQLRLNQRYQAIQGSIFFSLRDLLKNPHGFTNRLRDEFYRCPAQVPA